MKERPILFSTLMVQALLAGNKTQTRRIVKIPDLIDNPDWYRYCGNSNEFEICRKAIPYDDRLYHQWERVNSNAAAWVIHSHKPGDILWVRETWNYDPHKNVTYVYKAQGVNQSEKWHPSIHMPKEACRIKLQITNIRVERVQNISEVDAIAEGIERDRDGWKSYEIIHMGKHKGEKNPHSYVPNLSPITSYKELWESINGIDSWEKNPWVWAITFKKR